MGVSALHPSSGESSVSSRNMQYFVALFLTDSSPSRKSFTRSFGNSYFILSERSKAEQPPGTMKNRKF